jgi:hypothetical protein
VSEAETFLRSDPAKRLAQVKDILAMRDDEEIGSGDIDRLMAEIERSAHANIPKLTNPEQVRKTADALVRIGDFMRDPSSSSKLLLEYAALTLPLIK